MINKKGQAAMEFLMTYGWAILAAVIAIGVLAYFGVFSPGKYMPESCMINQPFGCDESAVSHTSGVQIVLRNGLGDMAQITSFSVSGCNATFTAVNLTDSNTTTVNLNCSPQLTAGQKFKGDITVTYLKGTTGTLSQTSTGSITKTVAA